MSTQNDMIRGIAINLWKDVWVLTSSKQIEGGQTLDAPPVRLVEHSDRMKLIEVLKQLLSEKVPRVPQPDWNDPRIRVGIRAEALGLKSWRAFVKDGRCFNLEFYEKRLVLEEWPKEGGSFTANASWKKEFPPNALGQAVEYLLRRTRSVRRDGGVPRKRRTATATGRRFRE